MGKTAPAVHRPEDQGQARFNQETADVLGFVLKAAGVDYDTVTLTLTTSPQEVKHRLGRPWQGWYVVDQVDNVTVYRGTPPTVSRGARDSLWLQSSGTATVTVLVF